MIGRVVLSTISVAQELPPQTREEFRLIAAAHSTLARYQLAVDVHYGNIGGVAPFHAEVRCLEPNRCLRSIGGLNILQTPRWSIAIDNTKRIMTVARHGSDAPPGKALDLDPDNLLNAWLEKGAKVSGGEMTSAGRHWIFDPSKPNGPKAELYTDPESHLFRKFVYQVQDATAGTGRVEVSYTWGHPSGMTQTDFEEDRYILERGDTVIPANSYAGYKIIRADRH